MFKNGKGVDQNLAAGSKPDLWTATETELRSRFRGRTVVLTTSPKVNDWHKRTLSDYFPTSPMAVKDADLLGSVLRGLTNSGSIKTPLGLVDFFEILEQEQELIHAIPEPGARDLLVEIFKENYVSYPARGTKASKERAAYPYPYHLSMAAAFTPHQDRGYWRWFLTLVSEDNSVAEKLIQAFGNDQGLNPAERLFIRILERDFDPTASPHVRTGPFAAFCPALSQQCVQDVTRVLDMPLPHMDLLNTLIRTVALHFMVYFIRLAHELRQQSYLFFSSLATDDWGWIDNRASCFDCTEPSHLEEAYGPVMKMHFGQDRVPKRSKPVTSFNKIQKSVYWSFIDFICFRLARNIYQQALGQNAKDYRDIAKAIRDDAEFSALFYEGTLKYTHRYFEKHATFKTGRDWYYVEQWLGTSTPLHIFHETVRSYYSSLEPNNRTPLTGGPNVILQLDQIVGLTDTRPGVGRFWSLNSDLLLLITNLAVPRNMKRPVTHVFEHFKRYGLHFDEAGRTRILNQLQSLGMLQKYSDSGEAIYVRSLF